MSALKDVALKMVGLGWYVLPLGVKSKLPDGALARHGYLSASNDPAQIEAWWTASPDANIGIDLGRSNLTVLDFDNGEPPAELNLPPTLTVKTSRGTHVYFVGTSKQGDLYLNNKHIGEIKSKGGYVLGPFSVRPTARSTRRPRRAGSILRPYRQRPSRSWSQRASPWMRHSTARRFHTVSTTSPCIALAASFVRWA